MSKWKKKTRYENLPRIAYKYADLLNKYEKKEEKKEHPISKLETWSWHCFLHCIYNPM